VIVPLVFPANQVITIELELVCPGISLRDLLNRKAFHGLDKMGGLFV
jgi:hypothetical protein